MSDDNLRVFRGELARVMYTDVSVRVLNTALELRTSTEQLAQLIDDALTLRRLYPRKG